MGSSPLSITPNYLPAGRIDVKEFSEARLSLPQTYRFCTRLGKLYVFWWNQKST
jgi:hypothetical protein